MPCENESISQTLRSWEECLGSYTLPQWEEIPDFGLYMEQVIILMGQYLNVLPDDGRAEPPVTAAAVNNYVRTHVMPKPQKKKYYRVHIAYLIVICTMKQSLSIAKLQKMLPSNLSEAQVHAFYNEYSRRHRLSARYFVEQVHERGAQLFRQDPPASVNELICLLAAMSSFSRQLAEKLLTLAPLPEPGQGEEEK